MRGEPAAKAAVHPGDEDTVSASFILHGRPVFRAILAGWSRRIANRLPDSDGRGRGPVRGCREVRGVTGRSDAVLVLQRIDEHGGRPARVRLGTVGQVNDAELPPVDFIRDIVSVVPTRDGSNRPPVQRVSGRKLAHQLLLERSSDIPSDWHPSCHCWPSPGLSVERKQRLGNVCEDVRKPLGQASHDEVLAELPN